MLSANVTGMAVAIEAASHLGGPMREALVILGAAAIVIPLFHRLRISTVLGFMLVGVLVGPSGLGALAGRAPWLSFVTMYDPERIATVADTLQRIL